MFSNKEISIELTLCFSFEKLCTDSFRAYSTNKGGTLAQANRVRDI